MEELDEDAEDELPPRLPVNPPSRMAGGAKAMKQEAATPRSSVGGGHSAASAAPKMGEDEVVSRDEWNRKLLQVQEQMRQLSEQIRLLVEENHVRKKRKIERGEVLLQVQQAFFCMSPIASPRFSLDPEGLWWLLFTSILGAIMTSAQASCQFL